MKVFFVTVGKSDEVHVIQKLKPPMLLLSYYHFRNKDLKDFVDLIGYKPIILLDSGAYTAFNTGKNIALVDLMDYITRNSEYITAFVALDVIGEDKEEISKRYYDIMICEGFEPIPVFHYGDDFAYLDYYTESNKLVALGGTVPIKDKNKVAEWVRIIINKYPNNKFHLLGSSSNKITSIEGLYSCDASSWIMMAANGYPKEIPGKSKEAKRSRMEWHMKNLLNLGIS